MDHRYRLQAKQVFLTYPQCGVSKEELADHLMGLRETVRLVVAQEKHEDGSPHLHAYVNFREKLRTTDSRFFDYQGHHPNVQPAQSPAAVVKYVQKDGDFIQRGIDMEQFTQAKKQHRRVLGEKLIKGTLSLVEAVQENPELLFGYKKLKADLASYQRDHAEQKPTCEGFIPNQWERVLPIVTGKKKHFWIWSTQPNRGKTTWLRDIADKYRASWYSYQESFQSIKSETQFLLLDEYSSAHLKVTQLNQMADGTYQYPQKGEESTQANVIMLVVGNKHPQDIYVETFVYIEARFEVINVD